MEVTSLNLRFDVLRNGNNVGDTFANGLNLALNAHVLRTRRVDLAFGGVFGFVNWADVELDSGQNVEARRSGSPGAQFTLDINFGSRWGLYFGSRYQISDVVLESPVPGIPEAIPADPMIGRFGATVRFGGN